MGVGSLLIFFTRAGLMELSNLSGTPGRKHKLQLTHTVVPLVDNNILKSEWVIQEGRTGSASSRELRQKTAVCHNSQKNKLKYRSCLLLNYDTGHIPVNLRFQQERRRQICKVKDFITAQDQCSHTCPLQSRSCTKPAKASHFIFEWCWCIFPLETKVIHFAVYLTEAKRCSILKALSPLHQLFALSPPTQTVCVSPKSNIPLLGLFAVYSGKFSVRQEISGLRPMSRWKAELWCLSAKYPSERQRHHRSRWYFIRTGVREGGFSFWPSIIVTVFALLKCEHKGWNWSQRQRRGKAAAPQAACWRLSSCQKFISF